MPGRTLLTVGLILMLTCCLRAAPYEAPQIWTLNGASLSYTRALMEQSLGSPIGGRALVASWHGERWEYTYRNGLKADFADRNRKSSPVLLVGSDFKSRGIRLMKVPVTKGTALRVLGKPDVDRPPFLVYADPDRQAFLTLHLDAHGRIDEICVSRFRFDNR